MKLALKSLKHLFGSEIQLININAILILGEDELLFSMRVGRNRK
jgi:hypothetical protein